MSPLEDGTRLQVASEIARSAGIWARYDAWNQAIASTMFGEEHANRPVYLDLDDDGLASIAARVEGAPIDGDPGQSLAAAVRQTLALPPRHGPMFRLHRARELTWERTRRDVAEPPPVLGLLAVFVLAAEAMEKGEGMAPHNYYGRLAKILHIPDDIRPRLDHDYRAAAEDLFRGLNRWLSLNEGRYGLPTALALPPHPYVGLPISQALVRADDRARLRRMFADLGLSPGDGMAAGDMQLLIKQWLADGHGSASLRRLWAGPLDVRARVVELALAELAVWDGAGLAAGSTGDLRIVAQLRGLVGRRISVSLAAEVPGTPGSRSFEALDPAGVVLGTLDFISDGAGRLTAADSTAIDSESILAGRIRLRDTVRSVELTHQPRALYVLQHDDGTGLAIERERVALGGDCLVLVMARLRTRTEDVLDEIARPGWRAEAALAGLPSGWIAISNVQVIGLPKKSISEYPAELGALMPAALSQVTVGGGLSIPGAIRRWSSLRPPEIRAIAVGDASVVLAIGATSSKETTPVPIASTISNHGLAVIDLEPLALADGDYAITVFTSRRADPQIRTLRLRSSATREDARWADQPPLAHPLTLDVTSVLSAVPTDLSDPHVRGAEVSPSLPASVLTMPIGVAGRPAWPDARRRGEAGINEQPAKRMVVGIVPNDDCVETGRHVIELPEAKQSGSIRGTCLRCGLVKRYPATWYELARQRGTPSAGTRDVAALVFVPPVNTPDDGADWPAVLDAVFYLGRGREPDLDRLAAQLRLEAQDQQSVVTDAFIRTLDVGGHIEVRRDPDGRAVEWQVVPPMLAGVSEGAFLLVGWRSADYVRNLGKVIQDASGRIDLEDGVAGPPSVWLRGVSGDALARALDGVGLDPRPSIVERAGATLAATLPRMSEVFELLPERPTPAAGSAKQWDPATARWGVPARPPSGALRFSGFSVAYGYVDDVQKSSRMRVADARVVKHIAALRSGLPLIAYSSDERQLVVPLGADLPGLYGRAAVLASGRLPVANLRQGALIYPDVPEDVASMLISKLSS